MSDSIAPPMSDNVALRTIVAQTQEIEAHMRGAASEVVGSGNKTVNDSTGYTRPADPLAIKAVVTNIGTTVAYVYEGGVLAGVIAANQSWRSPLGGALPIKVTAKPATSQTALIVIATYHQ